MNSPTQIALSLSSPVLYTETNFFSHEGTQEALKACSAAIKNKKFSFILIQGNRRFGKTHLLLKLFALATESSLFPKLIDEKDFTYETLLGESDVFLLDNFDLMYVNNFLTNPAAFVNFFENCKKKNRIIIASLTHPINIEEPHTGSRINSAQSYSISIPNEQDIPSLCAAMASQRGIQLKGRKLDFTAKRIRRDIPSIEKYLERLIHISHRLGKSVEFSRLKGAL